MKKIISVLLSFLLIFLSACSLLPSQIDTAINLNLDFMNDKTVTCLDSNDRYILFQTVEYISEAEYYNEEQTEYFYYLWDIERNRLKSEYSEKINANGDNLISEIELNDDNEIILYCYDNAKYSAKYNLSFKKISDCGETYLSREEEIYALMDKNDAVDSSRFTNCQKTATYSNYINKELVVFLDEEDSIYIRDINKDYSLLQCSGKSMLEYKSNENSNEITYRLTDYESLNSIEKSISYDSSVYPSYASLSDKYTVIIATDDYGKCNNVTVWNNTSGISAAQSIEKLSKNEINKIISRLEEKIKSTYGVDIECFKEYDRNSIISDYYYNNDMYFSELMLTLYDFDYCLSTFPTEMYKEIISGNTSFEKLKFYFIGNFDDEKNDTQINAYCSNYSSDADSELYIVYSLSGFTYSTFCHELMHAMEYRIWDYYDNLDDEWNALNPKDFEYIYFDNENNSFYENEEWQVYFARDYSMNNELEDRATAFEEVCYSTNYNEVNPWWNKNKPFVKKAALLQKALKASYPSLSNDEYSLWSIYDGIFA